MQNLAGDIDTLKLEQINGKKIFRWKNRPGPLKDSMVAPLD